MFSFVMHVAVTSYKLLAPLGQLVQYVLPYSNMAAKTIKGAINFNTKHLKKGKCFLKPFFYYKNTFSDIFIFNTLLSLENRTNRKKNLLIPTLDTKKKPIH